MRTDSIKRQARKHGMYNDPGQSTLNPFGRYRSHSPTRTTVDEETGNAGFQSRKTFPISNIANKIKLKPQHQKPTEGGVAGEDETSISPDTPVDQEKRDNDFNRSEATMVGDGPDGEFRRRQTGGLKSVTEGEELHAGSSASDDYPNGVTNGQEKQGGKSQNQSDKEERQKEAFAKKIPYGRQARAVLFPSWYTINWLLVCAPVGIAIANVKSVNPLAVFLVNFVAIIPLAGMLSFATEELAMRVGETLGGLLNATFGNAVELIVAIIALVKGEIIIVQTSLIGSILSNLLIVLGMCFFFGGLQRLEQFFNITVAQTASSLLALAVGSLLIPTAFTWSFNASTSDLDEELSRGTAIILLVVYGCYLFFQLKSHTEMYNEKSQKVPRKKKDPNAEPGRFKQMTQKFTHSLPGSSNNNGDGQSQVSEEEDDKDEIETPTLTLLGALITLAAATALIGVCSEFLVDSINAVTCQYHVSEEFVGLILLPIVGNAAEHATAVTVACKDKMDLAIGVAVGSSMQIALLVLPLSVVLGWIIGADMTLVFDDFQIVVLFVAVILVNYLIGDGKSRKFSSLYYLVSPRLLTVSL